MAHYLQFDGVNDEVTFPDVLAGAATFTINLDVNIKAAPLSFNSLLSNSNGSGGNSRNMIFTTNNRAMEVACIIGGVRRNFLTSNGIFNFNQRMMVQLQYDGATLVLRIDGVVRGSIAATGVLNTTSSVGDKGFTRLGLNAALGYPNIDLYGLEFIGDGEVSRFYNPSSSSGTSLVDTSVNAINGTILGGASFVFYNSITALPIPNNTLGAALNQPCAINLNNYFTGATSYSVLSGSLPTGLSIVGNQIVGTPTTAQSTTLVIRASNSIDTLDSATITFNTGLWYLQFPNNVDSRITLPTSITAPTTQFRLELDFSFASTSAIASYLHSNTGSSFDNGTLRIDKNASNELLVITSLNNKGRVITTVTGAAINTRMLITIEWDSTSQNIVIKRNTTTIATLTGYTAFDIAAINTICTNLNAAPFDLYGMKVTSNNTLVRNYDPSASGGVGNLLIDRVSNQNGTQAGTWPADNSEWVSYAPPPPSSTPTQIKRFDGTAFTNKTIKRWNGSAFVDVTLKRWNGSAFVDL